MSGDPPTKCSLIAIGQLGNQLFQIAALLRHCHVNNLKPAIFIGESRTFRYYDGFLHKCKPLRIYTVPFRQQCTPFRYIPIPPTVREIHGYLQSSKYFADVSGLIRDWFDPHPNIKRYVADTYVELLTNTEYTVVVHIRRGDYFIGANKDYHGILTPEYYMRAMNEMRSKLGSSTKFLIFTDDPTYCRSTYTASDCTIVDEPDCENALHLMSQFHHYILANSTFSWWAVYLGTPAQTVIAPDQWFGPGGPADYHDIYEPGWIRMKITAT